MLSLISLGFFTCFLILAGKAESNTNQEEKTLSLECQKYGLTDGLHYLKITQNKVTSFIIQIACENGDMIVDMDDYTTYLQGNVEDSASSSSAIEITVADEEVETGINPIDDDSSTYRGKFRTKSEYVIFLVIIIMVSVFSLGVFLVLYWFCCQHSRQNTNNDYDYDNGNKYHRLQTKLKNKFTQNVEYVPIPTNLDNTNKSDHYNDDNSDHDSQNNNSNDNDNENDEDNGSHYQNLRTNINNYRDKKYGTVDQQHQITV